MKHELMTEQVKTRVPKATRKRLEKIAGARHLDLSDIVREALRTYLDSKLGRLARN